jgi:hypothetical protein
MMQKYNGSFTPPIIHTAQEKGRKLTAALE